MKQREYIGFGSIDNLSSVLSELSEGNIFLVTGKKSYITSGAKRRLNGFLNDYKVSRFFRFGRGPNIEDVEKGIGVFKQSESDTIIAIGGGSVIDMAKLINFFASNDLDALEYVKSKKGNIGKPKPLIAVPTTAGSGSEATSFAVLYVDKEKFSVDNEYVLPDVAIVDPALTMSLPKYITATVGMDALSQAIESYWSINSNDESKNFARASIELTVANLIRAVNDPDTYSRLAMARAAHLAGRAINITRTTSPHAVSYPLTLYFGITHGHAVGLTLSSMLEYNAGVSDEDVLDSRGCRYVRRTILEIARLLGAEDVQEAKNKLKRLMKRIHLETRLSALGVNSKEDVELVIRMGFNPDRVKNNPRRLTTESLRAILRSILTI